MAMAFRALTVDRAATLTAGQTLDRAIHKDMSPPVLQQHVDGLFPNGVTRHGDEYFLQGSSAATAVNPNIELLYEYVRRAAYPLAPSRFESMFACETLADARAFRASPTWGATTAPIFEVETDVEPFRADMNCLTLQGSILIASYVAHRYWAQQPGDLHVFGAPAQPAFWELLLTPPVRVLSQRA